MVLLLSGSGRFAAGVFERDTLLCHKTFARYVTRRKQGGAQSKHDQKNGKAHSVGAQLRRHNESLLKWEIFSLLTEWKHFIASMNLIFISSSPRQIGVFFNGQKGKSSVLQKSDARLRSVPFSHKRPSLQEVLYVQNRLATVLLTTTSQSDKGTTESVPPSTPSVNKRLFMPPRLLQQRYRQRFTKQKRKKKKKF